MKRELFKKDPILMLLIALLLAIAFVQLLIVYNLDNKRKLVLEQLKNLQAITTESRLIKRDVNQESVGDSPDPFEVKIVKLQEENRNLIREKNILESTVKKLKENPCFEEVSALDLYKSQYEKLAEGSLEKAYLDYLLRNNLQEGAADVLKRGFRMKTFLEEDSFWKGSVDRKGIEDHSGPSVLAINLIDGWRVVHVGQDSPLCYYNEIEKYNFPVSMVPRCFDDETGEWLKRN